jgi:hypothetical protein
MRHVSLIFIIGAIASSCATCFGEARLGSMVAEFRQTFGVPSYEERLQRTSTVRWKSPALTDGPLVKAGVFSIEVATVDGIVFELFLRCQRRLGKADAASLAQRFVRRYSAADFARTPPEYNGTTVYHLSSGEAVTLRRERHRSFVQIISETFSRDIEVHDREAAKVRPPTANH